MKPVQLDSGISGSRRGTRLCVLLALLSMSLALYEFLNPSSTLEHGYRRGLWNLFVVIAGPYGASLFWLCIAFLCILVARLIWRHAPRVPGDRWF